MAMLASGAFTLKKEERICSKKLIDQLFNSGGAHALSAYPVRALYLIKERTEGEPSAQMMVSVPKRLFRHATDRNRIKRQLREAYRKQKYTVIRPMENRPQETVAMAFIWIGREMVTTQRVEEKMGTLLERIGEHL